MNQIIEIQHGNELLDNSFWTLLKYSNFKLNQYLVKILRAHV